MPLSCCHPRSYATLLAVVLVAITVLIGACSANVAPRLVYRDYVALGDSWTADVGTTLPPTTQFVPFGCFQSSTDYPHQVAALLHVATFRDASCSGATTDDMAYPQSVLLGGVNPPQFDRLTKATDLVTLGIGGNDIGLVGDVVDCLNLLPGGLGLPASLGGSCQARFDAGGTDRIAQAIAATEPKLVQTIEGIRLRSPHARILLVNYLDAIPANGVGCWPVVPIENQDVAYLQAKFLQMNDMLAEAARVTHAQLVDTYSATLGHDVCQAPNVRYVEGLVPLSLNPPGLAFPLHPNAAGAAAQTRAVYAAILDR